MTKPVLQTQSVTSSLPGTETLKFWHEVHDSCPLASVYAPAAHGEQDADPAVEKVPTGHVVQVVPSPKVPAGQATHEPRTVYVPAAHGEQVADPSVEKVPTGHAVQVDPSPKVPAGQATHEPRTAADVESKIRLLQPPPTR